MSDESMEYDAYEAEIIEAYEAKLREKDALITELCDALEKVRKGFDFIDRSTWDAYGVDDVIKRAREATR